jgi:cell division septum initiation protein DivIVA
MNALEPVSASEPVDRVERPTFPVVMRGYDRQQVQAFIEALTARLSSESQRADQMERTIAQMRLEVAALKYQPPPSYDHLGAGAARLFEQAGSSARLLVEDARNRSRSIVHQAEAAAAELIRTAEQRAAELEQSALDERGRVLAEAHEERVALRQKVLDDHAAIISETERLWQSRDWLVQYLGQAYSYLAALMEEPIEEQPEAAAGPDQEIAAYGELVQRTVPAEPSEDAEEREPVLPQ